MGTSTRTTVIEVPDAWVARIEHDIGEIRLAHETMRSDIAAGVADGMRELLADDDVVKKFWRRGYAELTEHGQDEASRWIGRRILTSLVIALVTAGLVWLVRSGGLK